MGQMSAIFVSTLQTLMKGKLVLLAEHGVFSAILEHSGEELYGHTSDYWLI